MTYDPEFAFQGQALPAGSLFDSFADRVLRRVDDVIAGRECAWPPKVPQRRLLELLRPHQGKARVVPLTRLAERLSMTPRAVKDLVQDLRLSFGVQLGASRDAEGGGYYLVGTEAESDESTAQIRAQAVTMLRVYHRMRGDRETLAELLRQIELELREAA